MPLLTLSAQGLLQYKGLTEHLVRQYDFRRKKDPRKEGYKPPAEKDAWTYSLPALATALVDAGLGDVEILIEYDIPGYVDPGNRQALAVDAILCGVHPKTGEPSYAVVELKQWASATPDETNPDLCKVEKYPKSKKHPALQASTNRKLLIRHVELFRNKMITVQALVYLHNAYLPEARWLEERTEPETTVITGMRSARLRSYLQEYFADRPGTDAAQRLLNSQPLPDTAVQTDFGEVVRGTRKFVLIDEQRSSFNDALDAVDSSMRDGRHRAVVVEGGPGTGKSVIGVELLRVARERGLRACYVVASTACRDTFKKSARGFGNAFITLNKLRQMGPDHFDLIICDEAQRLPPYPPTGLGVAPKVGDTSIEVLLTRGRTTVFLLDEGQAVRPDDGVTPDELEKLCRKKGHDVRRFELACSMRTGGSPTYATWVRRLLSADDKPLQWIAEGEPFKLQVADSPWQLERELAQHQSEGWHARIAAGFCWAWSVGAPGGPLPLDVQIDGWRKPWNARRDQAASAVPASNLWATGDGGFDQIGCVYTAQGLEYQWGGVIFGPDLVWRGDHWLAVPEGSRDRELAARCKGDTAEFERCVRNAYRVLLTRGVLGTIVYSTDPETREFLHSLVGDPPAAP